MIAALFIGAYTPSASAAAGDIVSFECYGYSGYYICHSDFTGIVSDNPAPVYDMYFVERSGLAGSGVSYESVNYPGYYLRHEGFVLYLEQSDGTALFNQDATFVKVSGLANAGYTSLQSYNYPTYYIRHQNYSLVLTTISTDLDRSDATFEIETYDDTFTNPRDSANQRPDPFVYKHTNGYYYGLCTTQDSSGYVPEIHMWKSTSLVDIYSSSTTRTIWTAPDSGWNSYYVWAPELHYINGVWYIYYSAGYRFGVLSNTSSDPYAGTWTDCGALISSEWAIDGTVLQQNGNMYIIYSHYDSAQGQVLKIQQMSSPTSLTGSAVQISAPTYTWETNCGTVNEGPQILQRNGMTFCVYSASSCASQYYCLGLLSISQTANPMTASNWTKFSSPLMQYSTENGLYGVGHCSFTTSPDGTEDWLVYHATTVASTVYQSRYVCMQQFTWNEDGTPNLWQPCGRYIPLPVPSGD